MRNNIAIVIGLVIGALINSSFLMLNGSWIPLPEGVDMKTPEGIATAMPQLEFMHFLVVFLAHALGTYAGALIATAIAKPPKIWIALVIGIAFLIGGIIMVIQIPSPITFSIIDLALAYIPMAWLGWLTGKTLQRN